MITRKNLQKRRMMKMLKEPEDDTEECHGEDAEEKYCEKF